MLLGPLGIQGLKIHGARLWYDHIDSEVLWESANLSITSDHTTGGHDILIRKSCKEMVTLQARRTFMFILPFLFINKTPENVMINANPKNMALPFLTF